MGAGQSYLYIYLKNKDEEYTNDGYTVTPSKSVVPGSRDFEVVTYKITYNRGTGMDFDIYIYDTKYTESKYSYIFAYCSPRQPTHVANEVKAYYSILAPRHPLVISFQRQNDVYNCPINELGKAGWDYAAYISKYASGSANDVITLLKKQFERLLWNRTLQFVLGKTNKHVLGYEQELGDKKNFRFVFLTIKDNAELGSECIFSLNFATNEPSCSDSVNPVDPYYFHNVKDGYYDGIMVYFVRDQPNNDVKRVKDDYKGTLLLMQFVDVRNSTILIRRKDKEGFWWAEEPVEYQDDNSLIKALEKIKSESDTKLVNTILLDNKNEYKGVKKFDTANQKAFIKYTHEFEEAKEPNFIFERKPITIDSLNPNNNNAKNVEVYYLKVTTTKGEKEDNKPFLIVLDKDGDKNTKKAYHFNNKDDFKEWTEFTFTEKGSTKPLQGAELIDKLDKKIQKIDDYGCSQELHLFKQLVYQILIAPDEDEIKPRPADPGEVRPDVDPEKRPPPEDKSLLIIIGCCVGIGVLVILSAVVYGVYWYNTTIKLLT